MQDQIKNIQSEYTDKVTKANSLKKLDGLYLALFGKSGLLTLLPKDFPKLDKEELRIVAPLFNRVKQKLEVAIEDKRSEVKEKFYQSLNNEPLDLTANAGIKQRTGHLHPLIKFEQEIVELFGKIGFQLYSNAPEIDTDYNVFEVLNIPPNHPARDLWDSVYIDTKNIGELSNKILLRTHTSNSQNRIMKEHKLPIRMMVLGRCFRYENLDARHEHTFDQFELVYIDKGLSMANLQYLSEYFLQHFLGKDTKVRLRPKYYPFVEPGVGIDGQCMFCKGKGCKVCGNIGWLELGGAGMIHPTVLKNGGIDPTEYSGIAWGPGLERILMLQHGINDLRLFRSGDLKFLQQF